MNTFWAQILPEVYPAIASFELGEFVFSCPEQLNRTHCPLLGWLVGRAPLTIREFTTRQSGPRGL